MPEADALILGYSHLNKFPREKDALHSLKKIASLVKPIMRARGWKVGTLAEFYPDQQNLLGINENRGQRICLRLRYPGDKNQFLPLEQVVDTMLHELSHNVIGPHNDAFNALWDQLRKEYEALLSKGYTGEGFLSEGHRLGGSRVSRDEARRIARNAAEKRRTLNSGSGQKLGGRPVPAGTDIRRVIVEAIERRSTVEKGCGGGGKVSDKDITALADQATKNGFGTKAEMDEANDRAIAQALWELVQEDEQKEYGDSYIPPTQANPTGNGGGNVGPSSSTSSPFKSSGSTKREAASSSGSIKREATTSPPVPVRSKPPPIRHTPGRPVSRLVTENAAKAKKLKTEPTSTRSTIPPTIPSSSKPTLPVAVAPDPPSPQTYISGWTCPICTLHNPITFLACDACTSERPAEVTQKIAESNRKHIIATQPTGLGTEMWRCDRCTTETEHKFWACRSCGKIKASS